jgi:hypothetical protein
MRARRKMPCTGAVTDDPSTSWLPILAPAWISCHGSTNRIVQVRRRKPVFPAVRMFAVGDFATGCDKPV